MRIYISRYVKEKVVYFIDLTDRYVRLVPGIEVTKENKIPMVCVPGSPSSRRGMGSDQVNTHI